MDIEKYIKGILRWWWLLALSTVIAGGASYYVSQQQPKIYQTTTTLMVGQVTQKANPSGNDFATTERLAESYSQMATRQPILQAAVDGLGLPMSWASLRWRVNAAPIPRTQLLAVSVEDTSPERAAAIADEIARQLILQSPTSPENERRNQRSGFVQEQLDDLETRIDGAQNRINDLETQLDVALSARKIQDLQSEINSLETLINNWQANYAELLTFLEGGTSPNYLSIIEPAQISYRVVSPDVTTNVALAAAVGFMLAFGGALLLEYLDNTIKASEDLEKSLGLTPLGNVVQISGKDYQDKLIAAGGGINSPIAEAYRLIRTNIQFLSIDQPIKKILITSSDPEVGKSLTSANLGIIMAQANLKTVIVDTDLRRPAVHKIFKVSNLTGVTDLLSSSEYGLQTQLKQTGINNLQVITSGPLPPSPAEMLGSHRMEELLESLESQFDVIILDTPPALAVTDATVLARKADGVVLVAKEKRTRRDAMNKALARLQQGEINILGIVLNQVTKKDKSYQYAQYYTHSKLKYSVRAEQEKPRSRWWQRVLPSSK